MKPLFFELDWVRPFLIGFYVFGYNFMKVYNILQDFAFWFGLEVDYLSDPNVAREGALFRVYTT